MEEVLIFILIVTLSVICIGCCAFIGCKCLKSLYRLRITPSSDSSNHLVTFMPGRETGDTTFGIKNLSEHIPKYKYSAEGQTSEVCSICFEE
mmetsp:Transcript_16823/g.30126  ORF Transcript_16823/g.30126 Transcript_16823/m.30126 type:complete len:92 (-) Transcript_16823:23517-23792(-)